MVTVFIALFKVIGELQRERLHHLHAAAFSWNGQMRGQLSPRTHKPGNKANLLLGIGLSLSNPKQSTHTMHLAVRAHSFCPVWIQAYELK